MKTRIFSNTRRSAFLKPLALATLVSILPFPLPAADGLMVSEPWSRPLPPTARNGAAYMMIHNHGGEPDRLVGGASDIADRVEVHTHIMQDGLMKMVKLDGLEIPAGETMEFRPHGLHIMFFGLTRPLVEGEQYELTLEFEKAGSMDIRVTVEDRGQGGMHQGAHGNHGSSGS